MALFCRLLREINQNMNAMRAIPRIPAPIPMPAFAPVERPLSGFGTGIDDGVADGVEEGSDGSDSNPHIVGAGER